jgi:hypothetical protein
MVGFFVSRNYRLELLIGLLASGGMTPCYFGVGRYQHCGRTHCLHLQVVV